MSRASRLLYSQERIGHEAASQGDVIAECTDGIPMGWLFCFGGRNFWAPDDLVADRGGTAAERNRFETPLEVADARLAQALDGLRGEPHMWVWFAPVDLLHRRIQARGKRGYLRLDATWAFEGGRNTEAINSVPAFVENYVNRVTTGILHDLELIGKPLRAISPFVPICRPEDRKAFEKAKAYRDREGVHRAAALVAGTPARDHEIWNAGIERTVAPEFAALDDLPPYPELPAVAPGTGKPATDRGLMGKLKSMMGRE